MHRSLLLATLVSLSTLAMAQEPGLFTLDALMDIRHPWSPAWSRTGQRIAFIWDRGGVQNLYVVGLSGGQPVALTRYTEGAVSPPFWSPDGRDVFFERAGELFRVSPAGGRDPVPVFGTEAEESSVRLSPDGSRIAFVRLGDIWIRELEGGVEKRLTVTLMSESGPEWSPNGSRIAFSYATGTPREDSFDYVGAKMAFRRFEGRQPSVGVVSIDGGAVTPIAASPAAESFPKWVDARRLSLQRVSTDYKTREVLLADVEQGSVRTLHRDANDRWWSQAFLGAQPRPSPNGRWVAFVSDSTGWDHLFVASTEDGTVHQVTHGEQEIRRPTWLPDGSRIAFDTNRGHPGQRHLEVVRVGDNVGDAAPLTSGRGTNTQPGDASGFNLVYDTGGWSPDSSRLVFQHTSPRQPADLYWMEVASPEPRRLTTSLPDTVDPAGLVEPELVWYDATDGKKVPAYLFVRDDLDRSTAHPAIIWVHGDGIAQNYHGWHVRRDYAVYYSFHQYLAQQGYVVIAPDYRGSVGYGKSWRLEPYLDLGGMDYEDVGASVPYLKSLGFVDRDRIGVWGLSYGGFMTLHALTKHPRAYACGVNVAGVQDFRFWWRDPGGQWINGRMGTPADNPDAYRRSAPIERLDRLERPLLVLHGTADVNVPFLESIKLIDVALKLGKEVDFAMYPGEFHYFHREHVLRDAWRRVEAFFGECLGTNGVP